MDVYINPPLDLVILWSVYLGPCGQVYNFWDVDILSYCTLSELRRTNSLRPHVVTEIFLNIIHGA